MPTDTVTVDVTDSGEWTYTYDAAVGADTTAVGIEPDVASLTIDTLSPTATAPETVTATNGGRHIVVTIPY